MVLTYAVSVALLLIRKASFFRTYLRDAETTSWDGSGHFAALRLFDAQTFPHAFGWTGNFFSGLPFPNFYPPLWFWIASAVHHVGTPLFLSAKILVAVSFFLLPLALGMLAHGLTGSRMASSVSVTLSFLPVAAAFMKPAIAGGLTLSSTFNFGIYTEPLGYLLLVAALVCMYRPQRAWMVASAAFYALALLANVFAAMAAAAFVVGYGAVPGATLQPARRAVFIASLALALAAFWWVPVARAYWTVVTEPTAPDADRILNAGLVTWILGGLLATVSCVWRGSRLQKCFGVGVLLLAGAAALGSAPGFQGLPLQLPRFIEAVAFLVTIPISIEIAHLTSWCVVWLRGRKAKPISWVISLTLAALVPATLMSTIPLMEVNEHLYSAEALDTLRPVLDYAKQHKDGRYLVQMPRKNEDRYEARALSAYLGAQGNDAAQTVYREDSTGALFYVPMVDSVSGLSSAFGMSSSLVGDEDMMHEPAERMFKQLSQLGVRYIVRRSSDKYRSQGLQAAAGTQIGNWEVYEVPLPAVPRVEALSYLPTLVVGDISFKRRRAGEIEMNRLLEEQFKKADFDLSLVYAGDNRLGAQLESGKYGGVIVTDYPFFGVSGTENVLSEASKTMPVLLLQRDSRAFRTIAAFLAQRRNVHIVDTTGLELGGFLGSGSGATANRQLLGDVWDQIATILRQNRNSMPANCSSPGLITCPVLVHNAYDPWWHNTNGRETLLSGPAATYTTGGVETVLTHEKTAIELLANWVSACSAVLAVIAAVIIRFDFGFSRL